MCIKTTTRFNNQKTKYKHMCIYVNSSYDHVCALRARAFLLVRSVPDQGAGVRSTRCRIRKSGETPVHPALNMSDSRHESKATVNVVDALSADYVPDTAPPTGLPYPPRPECANQLSVEELASAFHEMHLPLLPAIKLVRKDVNGRKIEGSALSISMGCGQTGTRIKLVEKRILDTLPKELWPDIASYHRTNGSMVGIVNMMRTCISITNRASVANLPNALRHEVETIVPYIPVHSTEVYPATGMRTFTPKALFTVGDHRVKMNPKSDSGIYYRDTNKLQLPVKNEFAIKRAQKDVVGFLMNLAANVKDMPRYLKAAFVNDPIKFLVHAKPKVELCKISSYDKKHRLIHVYPLWEQLIGGAVNANTWKRLKNFIEDPASPFMHNAGWHNGNAARFMERLLRLGEGAWGKNAGDDTGFLFVQLRVRPLTFAERGIPPDALVDDIVSGVASGAYKPEGVTYVDWDDNPITVERPWAVEVPDNVARNAFAKMPDIERFDLSLLMSLWQKVNSNCTLSLAVNPSRIMLFLITFAAFRYYHKDVLFHRSAIERIVNMGGAGSVWTTCFNSEIVATINDTFSRGFDRHFSTFEAKTGVSDPTRHHNSNTGPGYTVAPHPDDRYVGPYEVRSPRVVLTAQSLDEWFAAQCAHWSGVGLRYKPSSLAVAPFDYKNPRIDLPFLGHKIVPHVYQLGNKTIKSYIAEYAEPLKSIASLLNGNIRMADEVGGPPQGAILMSQAVCIALGNCTNPMVYDLCRGVFETHADTGKRPYVDEAFLDGYALTDDIDIHELLSVPGNVHRPAFPTMERLQAFSLPKSMRSGLPPMYVAMSGVVSVTSPAPARAQDVNPFAALDDAWKVLSPPGDAKPVHLTMPLNATDRRHAGQPVETETHKLKRSALLAEHARRKREAEMMHDDADMRHYNQAAEADAESVHESAYAFDDDEDEDRAKDLLGDRFVDHEQDAKADMTDEQWAAQEDNQSVAASTYEFDADEMRAPRDKLLGGGPGDDDESPDETVVPITVPSNGHIARALARIRAEQQRGAVPTVLDSSERNRAHVRNNESRHNAAIGVVANLGLQCPRWVPPTPDYERHLRYIRRRETWENCVERAVSAAGGYSPLSPTTPRSPHSPINTSDEEAEASYDVRHNNQCDEDSDVYSIDYPDVPDNDVVVAEDAVEVKTIPIWIRRPDGDGEWRIDVDPNLEISRLRTYVALATDVRYVDFHLSFHGAPLNVGTISDHGICWGSTLQMNLRLLGGASAAQQQSKTTENEYKTGLSPDTTPWVTGQSPNTPPITAIDKMSKLADNSINTLNPLGSPFGKRGDNLRKGMDKAIHDKVTKEIRAAKQAIMAAKRTSNRGAQRAGFKRLRSAGGGLPMFGGVPSNKARKPRGVGVPSIKQLANGGERFSCKQLVGGGEIYGLPNVFTKIIDQPLNAGNSTLWSKLADRAKAYERFIIRKAELHYTGTCNTLSAGTIMGYVEKDPTDVAVGTAREVFDNPTTNFMVSVIERDWVHNLNIRRGPHYVHMGDAMVADDGEKRQDNPGVLRVYLDQVDSAGLRGYLYINYVVDLVDPRESVPDAIDFSGSLNAAVMGSGAVPNGANCAFYPLNNTAPRMNAGFACPNWYLAGTPNSNTNWTHTAGILSAMLPRASNVYYDDGSTTSPVPVPPLVARCSVFNIPAGSFRVTLGATVVVSAQASGTCDWSVQYSLCDSLDTGFTTWVDAATGTSTAASTVSLPSSTARATISLNGAPGRYVAFRVKCVNASGVSVTPDTVAITGSITRAAASIDVSLPRGTVTYQYPSESAALMTALSGYSGSVVLETPEPNRPPTIEERIAALERDITEHDTVSVVSRATPSPLRRP